MPLIASEDYPNKRIYLSIDSVGVEVQPIDIYKEHRERRRISANNERFFAPMVTAFGNAQIGLNKFTPRFTDLEAGVKIVPYDTTHNLLIRGSLISTADSIEGRDLFDRAGLVSLVDIDYQPPQVEIITVNAGSGLDTTQASQLTALFNATTAGTGLTEFSTSALANAPAGGGGGDATAANQTTIINAIDALPTLTEMENSSALTATADLTGITANIGLILGHTRPMAKQLGLVPGVTATHSESAITVSDGDGSTAITDNGGGSYTVQSA